jgi:DtxR family manganese transport transcriptional regulator
MLRHLANEGFTARRPDRDVFLTEAGQELARTSRLRHRTVECFLRALGISPDAGRIEAEDMEHHVSPETLQAFERFLSKKPATAAFEPRTGSSVGTTTGGSPS